MENPFFKGEDRTEFGHEWKWQKHHWISSEGNLVRIFPPSDSITSWFVIVCDEERYEIAGEDAEQRAFAVGEVFTRQDRSMQENYALQPV